MPKKTLISYNINGIRAAIEKGLLAWISANDFDVMCFQEIKALEDQLDLSAFAQMGYRWSWHPAEKKGYSGVATFSKQEPTKVVMGMGIERYDAEGRVLRTDFDDWTLLNCYFPSGTSGDERQAVKMDFLADFLNWVKELKAERPNLIVVGDYNIAHNEIDIHDPVRNKKSSGFLPEERSWLTEWFAEGFSDAFRQLHPNKTAYSWWSYRANARINNKGWRIDYQSITEGLRPRLLEAGHLPDALHSDHCPVRCVYEL